MISVVICAHNPRNEIFQKVLDSLKEQSLKKDEWELILVDNASKNPIADTFNTQWHPFVKVIVEECLGLSQARLTGVQHAKNSLITFVDDDNVLDPSYLKNALEFHQKNLRVGCFGGRSIPVFESVPPAWFADCGINLGCQDYGDTEYISNYSSQNYNLTEYPHHAPIGTGMVITKDAFLKYQLEAQHNPARMALGRKGNTLTSGEDNDIILTLVSNGYEIAYVPSLVIHHIIPANRYSLTYLKKMAFESNRSWVKVLSLHGISPWKKIPYWTFSLRKIKSWISNKPWKNELQSIKYMSACGLLKGQSEL